MRAIIPTEGNSPLVVNANTMKAFQIAFQSFQAISRRRTQVIEFMGGFERIPTMLVRRSSMCPVSGLRIG